MRGQQRKAYAVNREKHTRPTETKGKQQTRNPGRQGDSMTHSRKCSILLDHGKGDNGHTDDPQASCGNDGSEKSVTSGL